MYRQLSSCVIFGRTTEVFTTELLSDVLMLYSHLSVYLLAWLCLSAI